MSDPLDLDAMEKACREATEGPWRVKWAKHHEASHSEHWIVAGDGSQIRVAYSRGEADGDIGEDQLDRDLIFAANARQWVPELLAEVRRLRDRLLHDNRLAVHRTTSAICEAVEAEREECAEIADREAEAPCVDPGCCVPLARGIAAAIRARGDKKPGEP